MSANAPPRSQLTRVSLTRLTRIVFENIELGRYYYVRRREAGYAHYDMFGRVSLKNEDRVRLEILYMRQAEEGEWGETENEEDNDTVYDDIERPSINSDEQYDCSQFYLPPGHSA